MKTVVITGSTHGIGYGLADALLERSCNVVVNGRRQASVDEAITGLSARHGAERVSGFPGDAADFNQIQSLMERRYRALWASGHLGQQRRHF